MFKRILAAALVLCLLLAGCGKDEAPQGTLRPLDEPRNSQTTAPTDETVPQTHTPSDDSEAEKEAQHVSFGSLNGGIYENAYVGYGCRLEEGWEYKSADQIQDISSMTQEILDGTDLVSDGEALPQITDMIAENVGNLQTMNVQYTRLTPQERIAHEMLTEEALIDGVLTQKDALVTTYAQAGIEVSSMEKVKVNFLGQERYAVHTVSTYQGVGYYILQIFDIHLGNYYVTLTLGSFVSDTTYDLLDLFYPLS